MNKRGVGSAPKVLLVAHTLLSLRYLTRYKACLDEATAIDWYTAVTPDRFSAGLLPAVKQLGLPMVTLEQAVKFKWSGVMFGAHGPDPRFRRDVPRMLIQHGIGSGKQVNGADYSYGAPTSMLNGEPVYDLMLEASAAVRDRAVMGVPQLADRIKVVGDLFCDDLLMAQKHRAAIRSKFGLRPGDRAVLISSTWGPNGTMESQGERLLADLARVPDNCHVFVTMHPHLFAGEADKPSTWPERMRQLHNPRIHLCKADESWVPHLTAADVALIDHSSQGLYWSLLNRPTVVAPVAPTQMNVNAEIGRFRDSCPSLGPGETLWDAVEASVRRFNPAHPDRDGWMPTSYPGQAEARVRSAILDVLGISVNRPQDQSLETDLVVGR